MLRLHDQRDNRAASFDLVHGRGIGQYRGAVWKVAIGPGGIDRLVINSRRRKTKSKSVVVLFAVGDDTIIRVANE